MKQRKDWTGRDHRRSLGTDRSQGSKKFLIAVKNRGTERLKSVLGPMSDAELAKIGPESFARC